MSGRSKVLAGLLTVLSLGALSVSLYLTWSSWQSEAVAGCDGNGTIDCDAVLTSHWSRWLGMPVSLFGSFIYLAILAVCWPAAKRPGGIVGSGLLALSLLAAGAAVWFIAIQAVFLQSFCPYCLGVHICGLSIAGITLLLIRSPTPEVDYGQMRSLLGINEPAEPAEPSRPSFLDERFYPLIATGVAAVGLMVLMGGQLLFIPAGLVVESLAENDSFSVEPEEMEDQTFEWIVENSPDDGAVVLDDLAEGDATKANLDLDDLFGDEETEDASTGFRRIFFRGLQKSIDLSEYPMLGNRDAPLVMVEMLDYTCRHCRHLHPFIESALDEYGNQIAFVIHHVPLNSHCNSHVVKDQPEKKDACDYARLAIGVWKLAPQEFPQFHSWLMESEQPPSIFEARKRALNIAGEAILTDDSLRADLDQRIVEQCDAANRMKTGLPVLLTEQSRIKGVPRSEERWTQFIDGLLGIESKNR